MRVETERNILRLYHVLFLFQEQQALNHSSIQILNRKLSKHRAHLSTVQFKGDRDRSERFQPHHQSCSTQRAGGATPVVGPEPPRAGCTPLALTGVLFG